ncbi:MAG: hypothetical protein JXX14_18640 [Deltaproteobacteria bacterium]|nr:hypothetical protein [Deltaproteobacteria bacterium]
MEQAKQLEGTRNGSGRIYKIFSIVEKPGNDKNLWLDIGVGRLNRDDSITCKLDCLPLNGVIQIRPHDGRKNGHMNTNSKNDGGYQG